MAAHLDRASPQVKEMANIVLDIFASLGPHAVVAVKTMIVVRAGGNFAGLVVRRDALDVAFFLPRRLADARIHKIEQLGPSKFAHHTRLSSVAEIDRQLQRWLREAYEVATASV